MTSKEKAIGVIQTLNDDVSLDEVIDRLSCFAKSSWNCSGRMPTTLLIAKHSWMNLRLRMTSKVYWTKTSTR